MCRGYFHICTLNICLYIGVNILHLMLHDINKRERQTGNNLNSMRKQDNPILSANLVGNKLFIRPLVHLCEMGQASYTVFSFDLFHSKPFPHLMVFFWVSGLISWEPLGFFNAATLPPILFSVEVSFTMPLRNRSKGQTRPFQKYLVMLFSSIVVE